MKTSMPIKDSSSMRRESVRGLRFESRIGGVCQVAVAVVFVVGLSVRPAEARVVPFGIGVPGLTFGSVELDVPDAWTTVKQTPDNPAGLVLELRPPGDKPFLMLLTPLPFLEEAGPEGRCKELRPMAEKIQAHLGEKAEEPRVVIQELLGSRACGLFVSITDRSVKTPTLKDFKYGTMGCAAAGNAVLTFTILTNLKDPPELKTALDIIGSARHVGSPASARSAMAATRLSFPGKDWGILIDLDGFKLLKRGHPTDRPGMQIEAAREDQHLIVSVFLEADKRADTPAGYRKWYRENFVRPLQGSTPFDVQNSERPGMPVLEYSHTLKDANVIQRHMNGFLVHDGVWVDVHISEVGYAPADHSRFDRLFDSVKIDP